jgi:ubiquinone/menaquinone biosynthesis C-methylase UbiE
MPRDVRIATETLPGDEHAFKRWMHQHPTAVLQAAGVTEGLRVLDYGCNRGVFTLPAARRVGASGRVYAADVNAAALEQLRHKAEQSSLDTIETVPIEDKTNPLDWLDGPVDVVLLYDVLQVIDDKPALLHALYGALKPSGRLSMFPMHVGVDRGIALAQGTGGFVLEERYGMLLNFRATARTP